MSLRVPSLGPPASRITVVVATRNRRADLMATLPRHEAPVILVDNGSADDTVAAVRAALPQVDVVALPVNRGAPARNLGVARARTPYVAFADDDSWWAPGALARAVEHFDASPRLAVLAARILVGPRQRLDPECDAMPRSPLGRAADLPGPDVLGFVACGAVVRRSTFLAVGGFDEVVLFPGEEERVALDLAAAGWGLAYVDDVVAHHDPSPHRHDGPARVSAIERSALLTAWMRRPLTVAVGRTARSLRAGGARRRGALAAMRQLPAAVRRRRPVPATVEQRLRLLASAPDC